MSGGEAEEEDWFEKALQESDEESTESSEAETDTSPDSVDPESEDESATEPDPTTSEQADDPFGGSRSDSDSPDGGDELGGNTDSGADPSGLDASTSTESDPFGGGSADANEDAFGGDDGGDAGEDPFGGASDEDSDDDPFGGTADGDTADDDQFGGIADGDTADDDPFGGTADGDAADDDPFGGTADGDTADDDPFGGAQGGGDTDTQDPFGGNMQQTQDGELGAGGSVEDPDAGGPDPEADPFGGTQTHDAGPDDNPFGEDFADAMGGGDGDMGGGFGGGGNDPAEFEDEDFESEIDRLDIGIEGLDDMILGGVPIRSLMTVIGSAGTGKTTFGLQFLNQAMANGGSGVYITLEETEEAIVSTAEEKGWPFSQYIEDDKLVVVSMDPIEMANSLDSIRGDISRLVNNFGADRLVLDSVSLLEMMYDHPAKRRSEVFDFARSLKGAGVTTMLTSEANADNSYQSRHGLVEYLVDAVFVLQYVRPSDFQETRLAVEIQKIRDANHSRETKPYDITDDGISVYRQANIF